MKRVSVSRSRGSAVRFRLAALVAMATVAGIVAMPGSASAQREKFGNELGAEKSAAEDVAIIAKTFDWEPKATAVHLAQQQDFGRLINRASIEFADVYGGAEYAEEPGAVSQIMIKGDAPQLLQRWVEKSGLKIELVEGMKYSERELAKRADIIMDVLAKYHDEVTSAVLPSGEIQFAVSGKLNPEAELPEELLDGVAIVEGPEDLANPEADIVGGALVYGGGGSCTSAFSVRHNTTNVEGVATAAHCTGITRFSAPGLDPVLVNQAWHAGTSGDLRWKTAPGHNVLDDYWASPTSYRDVSTVWPSGGYATNMVTCVYSRVQGTRSCDQIYSTNTSVKYSGFARMRNMIATDNDNTVPGDSGGPWSYGSIADGVHSGDKWIWFGTRNTFSRAGNLSGSLGVTVMTTP